MYTYLKKRFSPSSDELNVLGAFKPMYIIISVFGLMPYSLRFPKAKEGAIIIHKSIYFSLLCAVSIILMLYSCTVLHIQQLFSTTENNTMTEVLATKMNYMLELLGFLAFATIAYFCSYKNRLIYVKILNAIVASSNKFLGQSKEASLQEIYVQVKIISGYLCILLSTQLAIDFTRHDTMWKKILVALTFILPQMIQFTVISFYYVLISMIVGILKNINDQLTNIVTARRFNATKFAKREIRTVDLGQIEKIYVNVVEIKRNINEAFQASILATAIQCFHSLVSETYIIYHGLSANGSLTTHDIFNCMTWVGYQLLKIYTVSRSGVLVKEQVAKIGRSLHNIPTGKEDSRLYLEIQHFSSLITYQNAELTVYDYFPLDATLMFNIVTSAVMYLIILVQFDV